MFRRKSESYWTEFAVYQSYESVEQLFHAVSSICNEYDLPESVEAVLNTLKLHSQTFVGVCWLKVSEIARKANVSVRTVHRSLSALKENGIISIISQINTRRGGKAPNVYIINRQEGISNDIVDDMLDGISVEPTQNQSGQGKEPTPSAHKNLNSSSHNNSDNFNKTSLRLAVPESFDDESYAQQLKNIPQEFIDIFKPYYGHSPDIIVKRWRTAVKACEYGATDMKYVYWETIRDAWITTVRAYKLRKIRNSTDDGLGGYFYKVLAEMALNDYIEYHRESTWGA